MCFSLIWFRDLLIMVVIVCAIIAILKLLVPYILGPLRAVLGGATDIVVAAITIVFWAIVAIIVIYICFALISCLLSYGGGFTLFPPR